MSIRHLVIPGQVITSASDSGDGSGGFLRGHGTYIEGSNSPEEIISGKTKSSGYNNESGDENDDKEDGFRPPETGTTNQRIVSSVAGVVERVNKLISVTPFSPMPYNGNVGDLIVGRIISVGSNRWKVHLGHGCREAHLPLSGVNLPGGVQRIRTAEDALTMRTVFTEGDLLSAEVQQIGHAGIISLHTRSLRYGKLENGCMISVPPALVKRMTQHNITLPSQVDVLIGTNGFIWIQRTAPKAWQEQMTHEEEENQLPLAETLLKLRKRHATTPVLPDERQSICRVRNVIEILKLTSLQVTPENIMDIYNRSMEMNVKPKDMLIPEITLTLIRKRD